MDGKPQVLLKMGYGSGYLVKTISLAFHWLDEFAFSTLAYLTFDHFYAVSDY
jgi:hypothetical protein